MKLLRIKSMLIPVLKRLVFVLSTLLILVGARSVLAQVPDNYILGKGDKISIQVFDEQDLTLTAQIGDGGMINYSYLGDLQVAGRTTLELETEITKQLKDGYLVNPSVNVSIVTYRPFYISGEVRSAGSYAFIPGLTLEKAIALAGGLTDRASRRKMYLLSARVDADKKSIEKKISMSHEIYPGDVINIKEGFF